MPSNPDRVYKHDGWQGWGHWLGTGNVGVQKDQQFLPFEKALLHARSLKLKGVNEWKAWCKGGTRPVNVPARPDRLYKHGRWQGYGHWLGTGNVCVKQDQQFLPFKKSAASRTIPRVDVLDGVVYMEQEHSSEPTQPLQARGAARV